jgi:hypothetical protein
MWPVSIDARDPLTLAVPQQVEEDFSLLPLLLGFGVNLISTFVGDPYLVLPLVGFVALWATIVWREKTLNWILFATVIAANPASFSTTLALNLLFAICLLAIRGSLYSAFPPWLKVAFILACASVAVSSINWFFSPVLRFDPLYQVSSATNYVLGPFLLVPMVYAGMQQYNDSQMKVKALLVYVVLPSTLALFLAYTLGTPVREGPVDANTPTGTLSLSLGNTLFNFVRTQIGPLLASTICVSSVVLFSPVGVRYKVVAGLVLAVNFLFLLLTGSVASSVACLLALLIIAILTMRWLSSPVLLISSVVVVLLLIVVWNFVPDVIKDYAGSRYQLRLSGGPDTSDRVPLWAAAANFLADHPAGIGWSLLYDPQVGYPHNDYLSYGIAYGVLCGLVYMYVLFRIMLSFLNIPPGGVDKSEYVIRLAGIGVLVVILVNSFSDHLSANRWYFNVLWSIAWFTYFSSNPEARLPLSDSAAAAEQADSVRVEPHSIWTRQRTTS